MRYRISPEERSDLVARLGSHRWRGSILGPEGTGKSTLLEDLEHTAAAAGMNVVRIRLTLDSPAAARRAAFDRAAGLDSSDCCFLDGGETFGWLGWRRFIRNAHRTGCGLVATVHRRCPLPVVYRTETSLSTALSLSATLAGENWNDRMDTIARSAFQSSGGNVREVFRACYWHCATAPQH